MRLPDIFFLLKCLISTTTVPTRNGNTNVPKRYKSDADPAMPVPTIPAKSVVNTNSVEPIPAGDGITAASITDRDNAGFPWNWTPRKRRYGIPYQKQHFSRQSKITPVVVFLFFSKCFEASSSIMHCLLISASIISNLPWNFWFTISSSRKISRWNFFEQQNRNRPMVITSVTAYPPAKSPA